MYFGGTTTVICYGISDLLELPLANYSIQNALGGMHWKCIITGVKMQL